MFTIENMESWGTFSKYCRSAKKYPFPLRIPAGFSTVSRKFPSKTPFFLETPQKASIRLQINRSFRETFAKLHEQEFINQFQQHPFFPRFRDHS
jgi:hypothetical protein